MAAPDANGPLFRPFETGLVVPPAAGARTLLLGGTGGLAIPDAMRGGLTIVQRLRPDFLALERRGLSVSTSVPDDMFDLALVVAGRHRGASERDVADALLRTRAGGRIVVSGLKDNGIASLRKRLGDAVEIEGALPKHHGMAFWFRVPGDARTLAGSLRAANPDLVVEGGLRTAPGMFSHDRVDAGSRLLAEALPHDLRGHVADFGAGWGYLSAELLVRCRGIAALDLFEADAAALDAARDNLAAAAVPLAFHWHDLTAEPVARRYDAVVTNPPFHAGRAAEPALGQAFMATAAAALKPGGRLLLVANRRLPYERTLAASFKDLKEIGGDGAFKVLSARR